MEMSPAEMEDLYASTRRERFGFAVFSFLAKGHEITTKNAERLGVIAAVGIAATGIVCGAAIYECGADALQEFVHGLTTFGPQ